MHSPANPKDTSEHGYPTNAELARIKAWPTDRDHWHRDLLTFVQSLWWPDPGIGWRRKRVAGGRSEVTVSTDGWKGNEALIAALEAHELFWSMCWESSHRGGIHVFRVR